MSQLPLPFGLMCPCGKPAHIDRRTPEQWDGQCRECGLVCSFRKNGQGWWVMVSQYRPAKTPLNMPKRYQKMWGSWLAGSGECVSVRVGQETGR